MIPLVVIAVMGLAAPFLAKAAEQPLFGGGATLVERVVDQSVNLRRLGIQAEDRRLTALAPGLSERKFTR